MKNHLLFGLLLMFAMVSPAHAEGLCTECMKSAQTALAMCLQGARTDAAKTACTKNLQAEVAACNAGACAAGAEPTAIAADAAGTGALEKKMDAMGKTMDSLMETVGTLKAKESCGTVGCNCSIVKTCVSVSCTKYDEKGQCTNQICVAWESRFVCK
ncbi:MAG: hypothetical protein PSX71_12055 [bacterium]|nr:hypothetical protein [bacterium]